MNCFQKFISLFVLNGYMQYNCCDVAYLLLAALADKEVALGSSAPADTYTNPCKEVLYRLASYKGFALERLARLLGDYAD